MDRSGKTEKKKIRDKKYSRRDFLISSGTLVTGGILRPYASTKLFAKTLDKIPAKNSYPLSKGYLAYNSELCSGCQSCMIACSLVNEGLVNLSLSRIQITRTLFHDYPNDMQAFACKQCPEPMCVIECPVGACYINTDKGNVRMIDADKCIGCGTCLKACPYTLHRIVWDTRKDKALKCDLCAEASFFDKEGGPFGSQACVETCPQGALRLVSKTPD